MVKKLGTETWAATTPASPGPTARAIRRVESISPLVA